MAARGRAALGIGAGVRVGAKGRVKGKFRVGDRGGVSSALGIEVW